MPILVVLLLWEVVARVVGSRLLPPASTVLATLAGRAHTGELGHQLGATLRRVAWAFALSMLLGSALGIAMGRVPALGRALESVVLLLLNLPALVTIVLLYVWFGLGDATAIAAVAFNKLPSTAITLREGARAIDEDLVEMALSFRVPALAVLRHAVLPQLAPYFFAAARTGFALIWKIVLVAELLGRSDGVGFQLQVEFQGFDVAAILAYTLAFLAIVQCLEWALLQPLERWTGRWR